MSTVIVSHPHVAAFASGVARGLAREGKLAGYLTGVAFSDVSPLGRLAFLFSARHPVVRNRSLSDIPSHLFRSLAAVEIGSRATASLLRRLGLGVKTYDALFTSHDAAVAAMPWPRAATAVYAYEDGALWTFRRARRREMSRIWDLPLPHYLAIERTLEAERRRWPGAAVGPNHHEPAWKKSRKDDELALATTVCVASAFTKHSLEDQDLRVPIVVTPYGFPVDEFLPRVRPPSGPFTVVAVGTHDLRKGTPYLLEAWKRAAIPDAELHLIGPLRLAPSFLESYAGLFRHWPHVAKSDLGKRYSDADLLAFPTVGDGFGLVIQEAMCCGTPVVTTPCGGGPECITDGVNGYLVPARDVDALVDRFRYAAAHRDLMYTMGEAARQRAERWTWREAGEALVKGLQL